MIKAFRRGELVLEKEPPRTQVNPRGLAKLYLPVSEISPFFQSFLGYCEHQRQRAHKVYWPILGIYSFSFLLFVLFLFDEFDFADEDDGALIIFGIIIGLIIGAVLVGFFLARLNKSNELKSRALFLQAFFELIQADLHPDSGIKGLIDHRKHSKTHIYKTKTSPYSGATKNYYKYPWARFKFTLIDGSLVVLKCVDKLKEKNGAVMRFLEIQKSEIHYNPLLYSHQHDVIFIRKELALSLAEFNEKPVYLGHLILQTLKSYYQALEPKPDALKSLQKSQVAEKISSPVSQAVQTQSKMAQYLFHSRLPDLKITTQDTDIYLVSFPQNTELKPILIQKEINENETYLRLSVKIQSETNDLPALLRVNPALAYGRFALEDIAGKTQVVLVKTLLYETLDQAELDTAIMGLSQLGNKLAQLDELPAKAKAYKAERNPAWERMLLENALLGLNPQIENKENKFKVTLPLGTERKQTVHIRFDRKDLEGNQLISILSYCGAQNDKLYETCLKHNAHLSYGAIGLGKLGPEEMFVVADNQLAETADPLELKTAIYQIAQKADRLEAILTGKDQY